ncbi:hypothetical protein K505DRAFT_395973, partial [Melanomma pulvis-pyrius CBS 109.77]
MSNSFNVNAPYEGWYFGAALAGVYQSNDASVFPSINGPIDFLSDLSYPDDLSVVPSASGPGDISGDVSIVPSDNDPVDVNNNAPYEGWYFDEAFDGAYQSNDASVVPSANDPADFLSDLSFPGDLSGGLSVIPSTSGAVTSDLSIVPSANDPADFLSNLSFPGD